MMNTDVVVIGSGGAGLISAISALKEGVSVTIMSKNSFRYCFLNRIFERLFHFCRWRTEFY